MSTVYACCYLNSQCTHWHVSAHACYYRSASVHTDWHVSTHACMLRVSRIRQSNILCNAVYTSTVLLYVAITIATIGSLSTI
jgi:hypothetical protein